MVEFYAQDVRFLEELGFRVRIVTRVRDLFRIPRPALFFCWWWTWGIVPVLLSHLFRRPCIITGTFNYHLYRWRPGHQRLLIAFAARYASANVFVSALERDAVARMLPVASPWVSPHTVDTDVYRPAQNAGAERDPQLLLTVASLTAGNSHRKCVAESIRAVAMLASTRPQLQLVIAGERGSDYPDLKRVAEECRVSDRVHFPGRVSREQKVELMQTCCIYLQPSRFEGFGLAGLEAMACGAPVVTSPVGAVPEVGGSTVLYVDGADPSAIADAITSLLEHPVQREALGAAARTRAVREFSPQQRRDTLRKVISTLGVW